MKAILHIALRELRIMATRPIYWFCMVFAPLFCYVFFTTLMKEGLPTDIPLGLVDNDNTTTTRALARNLDAFQMTSIARQYPDVTSARRAVQRGDIYGFYYIPAGTTRKANRQDQPVVSFYTNYSYLVAGSLVYRDMRTISELAGGAATRNVLRQRGVSEKQAMGFLQPVVIDTHPIGNPWMNYNVYLTNTLIPGILMLFIFMISVYGIGSEVKRGTAHRWIVMAGGNMWRALVGKLLPQFIVFWLMGLTYVLLLYGYFSFPCRCGIPTMIGVMTLGVFGAQGLGVCMYAMLPSLRLGLSTASLWGVISFSISGMSYPVMAMHPTLQAVSYLFPLRHYFLLYVNCALDGHGIINAWPFAAGLVAFGLLPLLLLGRLKREVLTVPYIP